MVRQATTKDIRALTSMLKLMTKEIIPEHASEGLLPYIEVVTSWFEDKKHFIYIDDKHRGFFLILDDTDITTPNYHRYIGTKVFIHKEHRKGRLLAQFYKRLFNDFKDGDIVGLTEIESEHIPVLEKRHKRIANVYLLNKEV